MTKFINALSEIIDQFDGFLIDQFGVIMDGGGPYSGAPKSFEALKRAGKSIVLLSNSGKRAAPNIKRLEGFGFNPESFITVQSSGETAFHEITRDFNLKRRAGAFLISRDHDVSALEGLNLERVARAEDADYVFITGSEGETYSLDDYEALLKPAAEKNLPAICTNPDMVMLTAKGPVFGAGAIAEAYRKLGGEVSYIGKPYPEIYKQALAHIAHIPKERILCIGDSPAHDGVGAQNMGLSLCLVQTGVHAGLSQEQLLALCKTPPEFLIPKFRYSP